MLPRLLSPVLVLLVIWSCASAPPASEPEPAPGPAPTTATGDLESPTPIAPVTAEPEDDPGGDAPPPETEAIEPGQDPEALQAEALELCQSAAEFIDEGEMENAVDALDRAYGLMLELPNDGNTEWLQARADLRVLVAELLMRAHELVRTTAAPPTTSWDLAISVADNEHVRREIRSFTNGEREHFLAAYERSGLYRPMILAKLEAAGLPSQLSWLPLVESNFKVKALSRASALGLWQFIASTGLRYGLERDAWVDDRLDPEKSTDAAIAYLTDLHGLFGDWPKALAAYNCGEARVLRLQNREPGEYLDFWDLYAMLPSETRRYVPRFFATLMILEDPEKYGVTLPEPLPPPGEWTTVAVSKPVQLARVERELELESGALVALNPSLRSGATPPREYRLKVPLQSADGLEERIAELPEWRPPTPQYLTHRVRRGDTLSAIARRYGSSVNSIMKANNLRSANRISPGQRLQIPTRGGSISHAAAAPAPTIEGAHTVRAGESLYSIARRYNTTVERLRADNGLSSNTIHPGDVLSLHPGTRGDARRYQVQKGDTLSTIADRHRVGLSALLRVNGLSSRSVIYPGQWLVIPQ